MAFKWSNQQIDTIPVKLAAAKICYRYSHIKHFTQWIRYRKKKLHIKWFEIRFLIQVCYCEQCPLNTLSGYFTHFSECSYYRILNIAFQKQSSNEWIKKNSDNSTMIRRTVVMRMTSLMELNGGKIIQRCVLFFFPFSSSLLHACARRPMRHLNNFVDFALFGAVRVRFTRSNTALNFMSMCSF